AAVPPQRQGEVAASQHLQQQPGVGPGDQAGVAGQGDHRAAVPGAYRDLPNAGLTSLAQVAADALQPDVAWGGRGSEERGGAQHPRPALQVVADGRGTLPADVDQPVAGPYQVRLVVPTCER